MYLTNNLDYAIIQTSKLKNMYENILEKAGLTQNEAKIYELLLKLGQNKASLVARESGLKRGLVYKILEDLAKKGVIQKIEDPGKIASFKAEHPSVLRDLINKKDEEVRATKDSIDQLLPHLISTFNLAIGRPGVRFFEGIEGVRRVWWDTLSSDVTEIRTYGDMEFLVKNFDELNKEYLKERLNKKIKKIAITGDSEFVRKTLKDYDAEFTQTRVIKNAPPDFSSTIVQIYNNKISFTTLSSGLKIGIIIEDPLIFQMQKNLFDWIWNVLEQAKVSANKEDKKPTGVGQFEMKNLEDYKINKDYPSSTNLP